ncbi:MAG: hypothetical protein HZB33_10300 [Nitrospirae bacterium]|nr:hypothetical protein [Nitrospirota bacterium]
MFKRSPYKKAITIFFIITYWFLVGFKTNEFLAMNEFYGGGDIYGNILKSATAKKTTSDKGVEFEVEPQMGWKTGGKAISNPTKVAADGLRVLLNGDIELAKKHAQWLLEHSKNIEGGLFFPFEFDFQPYYPYDLRAPWNSAITQGLALALFSYLYDIGGDEAYLSSARGVYKSYLVPIEKGGFTRFEKGGPFFEEYPAKIPIRVLNGAVVAMLALHDYAALSGDMEARQFFQKSVERFKALVPEYEVTEPSSGIRASSYSLAPNRPEVLGRFVGEGTARIYEMRLIGLDKAGIKKEISKVVVGPKGDDYVMADFYIWPDKKHMNWSEPAADEATVYREVNRTRGDFNHAPFKFHLPLEAGYDKYMIEVKWKLTGGKKIALQIYDENEFYEIGALQEDSGAGQITQECVIPPSFITAWKKYFQPQSKIDDKYLDDNLLLMELLGKITGERIFSKYASRWKESVDLVPALWINLPRRSLLREYAAGPVLPIIPQGPDSGHVAYPSVIKGDNNYIMYYSSFSGGQWNISLATSLDGVKWNRQGWFLDRSKLPAGMAGDHSFPYVVENSNKSDPSRRYLLYFSSSPKTGRKYDRINVAYSQDGLKWNYGGVAIKGQPVKPFVSTASGPPNSGYIMFYIDSAQSGDVLKTAKSRDGIRWSRPAEVLKADPRKRSLDAIAGVPLDGRLLLFVDSTIAKSRRHELLLYSYDKGKLNAAADNPVWIDKDWEDRWDAIRYGYNIYKEKDKYVVHYTGIPHLDDTTGAQIGRAELDVASLRRNWTNIK